MAGISIMVLCDHNITTDDVHTQKTFQCRSIPLAEHARNSSTIECCVGYFETRVPLPKTLPSDGHLNFELCSKFVYSGPLLEYPAYYIFSEKPFFDWKPQV
jgi:hypothetical protein